MAGEVKRGSNVGKVTAGAGNSWRVEEGIEKARDPEACGDEVRPVHFGVAKTQLRLEVSSPEDVKEVESEGQGEEEPCDGVGVMPVDVVEVPEGAQFIKGLVLDTPPGMPQLNDGLGGGLVAGEGGDPDPVAGFGGGLPLLSHPFTPGCGFQRANHPHGATHLWPGGEPLDIPLLIVGPPPCELFGGLALEQPPGVLEEVAAFVLEDDYHILVVVKQQSHHGGLGVEAVQQQHRERSRGVSDDPGDQPHGRGDLVLTPTLQLEVEEELKPGT